MGTTAFVSGHCFYSESREGKGIEWRIAFPECIGRRNSDKGARGIREIRRGGGMCEPCFPPSRQEIFPQLLKGKSMLIAGGPGPSRDRSKRCWSCEGSAHASKSPSTVLVRRTGGHFRLRHGLYSINSVDGTPANRYRWIMSCRQLSRPCAYLFDRSAIVRRILCETNRAILSTHPTPEW
jgi:hypothetical protein